MTLTVRNLRRGLSTSIADLDLREKTAHLRKMYAQMAGIEDESMVRMFFSGKEMKDEIGLHAYKLEDDVVIVASDKAST